jgi:uncharacterized protein (DUF849 family)
MSSSNKVIITCAVTGAIHTPSMSPHLPVTPEEIADAAVGACEAGAAIIHLHARDPQTGKPDQRPEAFEPFLKSIKQRCGAIVNLTTGGSPYMSVQERMRPAAVFKPEIASMNLGSMNFGTYPMLNRFKAFKHDWERPYLKAPRTWCSATPSATLKPSSRSSARTTRATSSSAMTRRTSTTSRISGASLANGKLEGVFVRCPAHGLQFDVRSGCMKGNEAFSAKPFAVQVCGDQVVLLVD